MISGLMEHISVTKKYYGVRTARNLLKKRIKHIVWTCLGNAMKTASVHGQKGKKNVVISN